MVYKATELYKYIVMACKPTVDCSVHEKIWASNRRVQLTTTLQPCLGWETDHLLATLYLHKIYIIYIYIHIYIYMYIIFIVANIFLLGGKTSVFAVPTGMSLITYQQDIERKLSLGAQGSQQSNKCNRVICVSRFPLDPNPQVQRGPQLPGCLFNLFWKTSAANSALADGARMGELILKTT